MGVIISQFSDLHRLVNMGHIAFADIAVCNIVIKLDQQG